MNNEKPLTVEGLMKLTGVSRPTVYRWIKRGVLEATKMGKGGRYLINPLSVPTFIRRGKYKEVIKILED